MACQFATFCQGGSPIIAVALHDGHYVRPEVRPYLKLSEEMRLREEDPCTGRWCDISDNRIIAHHSRFECDLNRPRTKAVYRTPEEAWGLDVWHHPVPDVVFDRSLAQYDLFYQHLFGWIESLLKHHGRVVVLDLHSYNHRRGGPDSEPQEPTQNPEINLGTGSLDRQRWADVVERFISDLRSFEFQGRQLDVRENVRFQGGEMAKTLHARYPANVCVLAVEVKKFFMNEWTAELDTASYDAVRCALQSTVPGLLHVLRKRHGAHQAV